MSETTPQPDPKALASELQRYREIAEKATAGIWRVGPYGGVYSPEGPMVANCQYRGGGWRPNGQADEAFIATFSPSNAIYLVDVALAQAKEIEGLKAALVRLMAAIQALGDRSVDGRIFHEEPLGVPGAIPRWQELDAAGKNARAALSSSPDLVGGDQGASVAESGGTALPKSEGSLSDGWQDISTAPEIIPVLVVCGDTVGEAVNYGDDGWWWASQFGEHYAERIEPTLWAPLPSAPGRALVASAPPPLGNSPRDGFADPLAYVVYMALDASRPRIRITPRHAIRVARTIREALPPAETGARSRPEGTAGNLPPDAPNSLPSGPETRG